MIKLRKISEEWVDSTFLTDPNLMIDVFKNPNPKEWSESFKGPFDNQGRAILFKNGDLYCISSGNYTHSDILSILTKSDIISIDLFEWFFGKYNEIFLAVSSFNYDLYDFFPAESYNNNRIPDEREIEEYKKVLKRKNPRFDLSIPDWWWNRDD